MTTICAIDFILKGIFFFLKWKFIAHSSCWLLVAGCWLLVAGFWLLDSGCWILVARYWLLVARCSLLMRSEVRGRRSEVGGQRAEVRGQRSENRGHMLGSSKLITDKKGFTTEAPRYSRTSLRGRQRAQRYNYCNSSALCDKIAMAHRGRIKKRSSHHRGHREEKTFLDEYANL